MNNFTFSCDDDKPYFVSKSHLHPTLAIFLQDWFITKLKLFSFFVFVILLNDSAVWSPTLVTCLMVWGYQILLSADMRYFIQKKKKMVENQKLEKKWTDSYVHVWYRDITT